MNDEVKPQIGSDIWLNNAEQAEWRFMYDVIKEAMDIIQYNKGICPSYFSVAKGIAEARSKSGWRAYKKP